MAAPTPTTRGTPAGIKLKDGFSTKITFARNTTISLWEKAVKPPGVDGGDSIDQTTMHNTAWETMAPGTLKKLTQSTFTAAYDPNVYNQIVSHINIEDTITVTHPDGSTTAFYGYLKSFEPTENRIRAQPEAQCVIVPTNFDPSAKVEAGPATASVSGT